VILQGIELHSCTYCTFLLPLNIAQLSKASLSATALKGYQLRLLSAMACVCD
jgi:hypothetical protein